MCGWICMYLQFGSLSVSVVVHSAHLAICVRFNSVVFNMQNTSSIPLQTCRVG